MAFDAVETLPSASGAQLRVYLKQSEGVPRGVVQINHGLAEHAGRYGRFADRLAAHGFHVLAQDHRGHGGTTAPDAPQRAFSLDGRGADRVLDDVASVHAMIAERFAGLPVMVFGHSMGGLITLNFLMRNDTRVSGAAIWNANFSAGVAGRLAVAVLAWERFRLGGDARSRILPRLTFAAWAKQVPQRRTDFDWLSRDPEEVDRYVADPLCGWDASVSMWRDVFELISRGADDTRLAAIPRDLPFNLLGGGHDPATAGGKAVLDLAARLRARGFSNLESSIWPETRHESLNEINRDAITDAFLSWLNARIG